MNTRLGEGIGTWQANAMVQCTAAVLSLLALLFAKDGSFAALGQTNKLYWFGGVLALVITVTVMLGIKTLSPTVAISVILISQLLVAAVIDAFGLMGSEKVAFGWSKYAGLALMVGGVLVFKWKG
jgi:transporter family-2 protein